MSCQTVQKEISAYLDQTLAEDARLSVSQHLARCRECAARSQELQSVRDLVRGVPRARIPVHLQSQLRVLASHEQMRRLHGATLRARFQNWAAGVWFTLDNLMRPKALPFAGGFVSAAFLFFMLVPRLGFHHNFQYDVPVGWYTGAKMIEMAPFAYYGDETVVELTIDERGQVTDYAIPHGKLTRELENNIASMMVLSEFSPATWFGYPTPGKVLVSFRRGAHIVVKG